MRVGFVGLGNIGKPMAERVARSLFTLSVFDVRPDPTPDLIALGVVATRSLSELAERSDLVEIVVNTTEQVRDVVLGPTGLLAALKQGSIIAVHSTLRLSTLQEIAARCAERGIAVLDAAVSGGDAGAKTGSLTFMVGGDAAVLDRCRPVFELMAKTIFHLGDIGAGQAGKLANNLLYNIGVIAALECVRLAVAAGIPENKAVDLIAASTGTNFTIQHWQRLMKIVPDEESLRRIAALRHKDVSLALEMAQELNVEVPLGAFASTRIDWAIRRGD
jgi:3-hydroxyisobutyrate dehydrogenase-like beta-hydroxyacid dehydrogenase